MKEEVIIIGAGLTGLSIAYLLKKRGIKALILEANTRIGGRILTIKGANDISLEMGATWFGNQHVYLKDLLHQLDLNYFEQHTKGISLFETNSFTAPQKFEIPSSEEPSFRIVGGTSQIINSLTNKLEASQIKCNTKIINIKDYKDSLILTDTDNQTYSAKKIISTIPPNLLINTVSFYPDFSVEEKNIFKNTHTWMGESIKFAVSYKSPFWRDKGFSGTLFSNANLIQEQYDHSGFDYKTFALKGFLNASSAKMTKAERKARVIEQLSNSFGKEANGFIEYFEKVWQFDALVFSNYKDYVLPHQNNGNTVFQKSFMNNKLYLSGTETSSRYGGYMDGAVHAANYIVSKF